MVKMDPYAKLEILSWKEQGQNLKEEQKGICFELPRVVANPGGMSEKLVKLFKRQCGKMRRYLSVLESGVEKFTVEVGKLRDVVVVETREGGHGH